MRKIASISCDDETQLVADIEMRVTGSKNTDRSNTFRIRNQC